MLVGCVPKATENSQNLHKHINKTTHTDYSSVIRKCRGEKGKKINNESQCGCVLLEQIHIIRLEESN